MEQQQCPICMLYLLPGMCLQDHLDTHPKDMIIKALLTAKTEPKPVTTNDSATIFLTTNPFNPTQTHIYQQQQQQHQPSHHQPIQNNFSVAKRNTSNANNALLIGNRPYRLTLDAPQNLTQPTATTFLNTSAAAVAPGYGTRTTSNDGETAFRCIQNTEQKNIMIVNTSSTQFIQQTMPIKKQPSSDTSNLVIIDTSTGMPLTSASGSNGSISIIPRYTSEKYSGPPPSYSSAISSVTNTINDKARVIDLTQTPATTTMPVMKQTNNKKSTLNGNGAEENHRHSMIRNQQQQHHHHHRQPQKILECTQNENGDFMITEKLVSSHQQPSTSTQHLTISHEEEIIEEIPSSNGDYNIKFLEISDNQMTYNIDDDDDDEHMEERQHHQQQKVATADDSSETRENVEEIQDFSYLSKAGSSKLPKKLTAGLKVLSNVKVTSSEMLPSSIKDIISQYNHAESERQEAERKEELHEKMDCKSDNSDDVKNEFDSMIHCTETMNLSKEKDESTSACTSVIRKNDTSSSSIHDHATESKPLSPLMCAQDDPKPSTSGLCQKPISVVFNTNSTNRLKINKQPKKLVIKLKKPLIPESECTPASSIEQYSNENEMVFVKSETIHEETIKTVDMTSKIECDEKQHEEPPTTSQYKTETEEQHFTVTFLNQHNFEPVKQITVTPEIHHDSETNQSLMSMDLEPETGNIKREQIDDDLGVVIKTELNTSSTSSVTSSRSSYSNSSPGPSRLTAESTTNENSQLNFLYQNDRVRFSPPLSPYVYLKTFSSGGQSDEQPKQELSWIGGSSSLNMQNDHNSTSSRYTPSFDDNRSNYTDLDSGTKANSLGDRHIRAPSTDSVNIRTDEKMPARGEISEQESNGEMEQPWHPYFQLQAFPSSYDMSTAQECWNLSKADSQNACDSNNIQNVIINFPPLNGHDDDIKPPDLLKSIIVTKQEPPSLNEEASGSCSNLIVKRNRSFRCPECSKVFLKLRARNRHMEQDHPHLRRIRKMKSVPTSTQTSKSDPSVFVASSSSSLVNWTAAIAETTTNSQEQEVKVLSIIKNEPSTSAAVLVKNEMNRILINGSIKMEMDRMLLEPSTSSTSPLSIGLKIKRTYMCAKCNEQFKTLKLLDRHFQIHPAECTLCQKTFNSWNTFSLHLKHHLNIRVHACRFCPKRFVQRQRLVEHERVHTGSMPIKCPECDERFRRYSNMLHHKARVHLNKKAKQEDFVCNCGEIYPTRAKLEWHQETHENKPKACPFCRERFTHRNSLTRHIRLSHTEKYVFVKSKSVNCPVCNCNYLPSSIKAHMATHHLSNKEYSCSICSKQFSTKWNLKQHHWTHANRSTKPFQCNICPSAFVRETDYTTHMNAHRSIKPYTCNYCGRQFVRKYNWLRHTREHEREKKFSCETCHKKFHRAYYLTEHIRVHTGERPFSCQICGKTSATKTNHNKHIRIHHARDPLTAEG